MPEEQGPFVYQSSADDPTQHVLSAGNCCPLERLRPRRSRSTWTSYLDALLRTNGRSHVAGWRPIATAPKDGTLIDLWCGDGRAADCKWGSYYRADAEHPKPVTFAGWVYYHEAWGEWVEINHEHPETITHWMPLPDSPQGE